jgi:Mn2+/Fe2+ NRAMP family transporter
MLLTNDHRVVGEHKNSLLLNITGWITTGVTFAAAAILVVRWFAT